MAAASEVTRGKVGIQAVPPPVAVGLLTVAGFLVRLRGIGQSLGGDELLSFWGTWGQPLSVVLERSPEYRDPNPPLFYLLARASEAIGDPTVTIRLPSLVAGTLLIPAVWLLGRRLAGERAALAAAALTAFNLTAVFFSTEARPYELLALLGALSTVALLRAVDSGLARWWFAWAALSASVMYTHYSGLFVLVAQAGWAVWVHRDLVRRIVGWGLVSVAMFLPWLPEVGLKGSAYSSGRFELSPMLAERVARLFVANPLDSPSMTELPGIGPLALLVGCAAIALAVGIAQRPPRAVREPALLAVIALASPLGMLLTSAVSGSGFLLTRYLSASFAALIICLAALLTLPRGRLGVLLGCGAVIASAWACVVAADSSRERPDMRAAAHWIDANLPADAVVADNFLGWAGQRPLGPYLDDPSRTPRKGWDFPGYGSWFATAAASGKGVAVAFEDCPAFAPLNSIPPEWKTRFRPAGEKRFPGGDCGIAVRWFAPVNG